MHVGKLRSGDHFVHCNHPRGELSQTIRGQSASEILSEHRVPFLGLFMTGEAAAERAQLLVGSVDIGDDVRSDLVVEQGIGSRGRDASGGRNKHVTVRHHHARTSVAQFDVGFDVGGERPVPVELGLSELHEGIGIEPRACVGRRRRNPSKDVLGLMEQVGCDGAEGFDAERDELR